MNDGGPGLLPKKGRSADYLNRLFEPKHVLLIGFSRDKTKDGYRFLSALIDARYDGKVSLLGRERGEFEGYPVYDDPQDLPFGIDLAVNLLSPAATLEVLPAVAARGLGCAVVFTAGFAETGEAGSLAQEQLVSLCREYGTRLVGPNCTGVFNLPWNLNLTTSTGIPEGNIGLVSQSGNLAITLWDQARLHDVGFSKFVSCGNQGDIPLHEYIGFLGQDSQTAVIALYLEGLPPTEADSFLATCAEVSRGTPIVALKGGRTTAGRRAAESHTAALSSPALAYSSLFADAGIIEVDHFEDLLPVCDALTRCPPFVGGDVAIVGSGGGHSTMLTDEVERHGLAVPPLPEHVRDLVRARLPASAPTRNPVDMVGVFVNDPGLVPSITELVLRESPNYSAAVNYALWGLWRDVTAESPLSYEAAGTMVGEVQERLGKPIVFYTPYADRTDAAFTALRAAGVPCYSNMRTVGVVLAALSARGTYLAAADPSEPPELARSATVAGEPGRLNGAHGDRGQTLSEADSYSLLEEVGIRIGEYRTVDTVADTVAASDEVGYPVVIKAVLVGVAHKSDVGAVRTGIADADAALAAAGEIAEAVSSALGSGANRGFLVMKDYGHTRELLVGVRKDATFGEIGLLGVGGLWTEALSDAAVCLLPATAERAMRALARLQSRALWTGSRGKAPVDAEAVAELLNRLRRLASDGRGISSVECNPVLVLDDGSLVVVDGSVERSPARARPGNEPATAGPEGGSPPGGRGRDVWGG